MAKNPTATKEATTEEVAPKTYKPEELATSLGVSGKQVRAWLRATFPRPLEEKNTSWVLSPDMAAAVVKHFEDDTSDDQEEAEDIEDLEEV